MVGGAGTYRDGRGTGRVMPERIEVKGDRELARALDGMAGDVKSMDKAATDAGRVVAADAQRRAPRRTGRLRSSITTRIEGSAVTVGTDVRYGMPVHQGVPSHHMQPQPFLTDALAATQPQVQATYAGELDRIVNTNAGKAMH